MKKQFFLSAPVLVAMLMVTFCTKQHDGFIIQGHVEGLDDSTMLYLRSTEKEKTIDSTFIINGEFQFKGKVDKPGKMAIHTKFTRAERPLYTSFWVDNSNITFTASRENFKNAKVTGSKPQEKANILKDKVRPYNEKSDSLMKVFRKLREEEAEDEEIRQVWKEISEVREIRTEKEMEFVKSNTNSYEALYILQYMKNRLPEDTLRMLYDKLNPEFKHTDNAKVLQTFLNTDPVQIGEQFIDFKAQTMDGNPFHLSDIKDKYILLDFWSAGCGPCRLANQAFSKKYPEWKNKMEIVSFSLDKNKETIQKAAEHDGIKWTLVSTYNGTNGKIPIQYRVDGVPTFYIIAPSGKVVKKVVGYSEEHLKKITEVIDEEKI